MPHFSALEYGKASINKGNLVGSSQVIVNADGTKPRMIARFDEKRNELVGELVLVNEWNKNLPFHYTIGRNLRRDYSRALGMKRGIFIIGATLTDDYKHHINVSFVDSSEKQAKTISFENIFFSSQENTILLPHCEEDSHEVFLEESLMGILYAPMRAAIQRASKLDFINRLHYAFVLNKYGVPNDQRNATQQQVCG